MNERPTKTIKLETSNSIVKIKEWINGREAEYVEAPLFKATKLSSDKSGGMDIDLDAESAIHEQAHRKIETYITSIQVGEKTITEQKEILEYVLSEIPNNEYEELIQAIDEVAKGAKKK